MRQILRVLVALLALCASARPSLADDISIGVAGPMSGDLASFGEQMRRGAEMAIKHINSGGGVLGNQLSLQVGDDMCDPKQAVTVANDLVSKGAVFVDGHFCSSSSLAALEIYANRDIVMITPASGNPAITEQASQKGFTTVFRTTPSYEQEASTAGDWVVENFPGKKIAILSENTNYGQSLADEVQASIRGGKLDLEARESFPQNSKDFSSLVSQLKNDSVDVVYVAAGAAEVGALVREAREQGYSGDFISSSDIQSGEFWNASEGLGGGVKFIESESPLAIDSAKPVIDAFRAEGFEPEGFTLNSYAAVQAWAAAASKAGTVDGRSVADVLHTSTIPTVLGDLTWDSSGNVEGPGYTVFQWLDGKIAVAAKRRCPPHCGKRKTKP